MDGSSAASVSAGGRKSILSGYKKLGLSHGVLDFRQDTLGEMIEMLDLVARDIRPAVDRA